MKKKHWYILILCTLAVTVFSGCIPVPQTTTINHQKSGTKEREAYRVNFSVYTDTPFNKGTPTRHIGYGGVYSKDLIFTAKHILTNNISRLVITNYAGISCPIKQVRTHNAEDIALIQTSTPCLSGATPEKIRANTMPKELLYIDMTLKKASGIVQKNNTTFLIDEKLAPGMSGSPVFLADQTRVGIITAQTTLGTEGVTLSPALFSSRGEIENIISQSQ